jgi:hypothetical protein
MQEKDYAMFTADGNRAVASIVKQSLTERWTWAKTYQELAELSQDQRYGEATDTAVREVVYDAIGAGRRDEEFYC